MGTPMCVRLGERMGETRCGCRSLGGLIAGVVLTATSALAAATITGAQVRREGGSQHVTATLIGETRNIVPGRQLHLALRQQIQPGWHTYWSNPGESGLPTTIDWSLPQDFRVGPILWPTPERFTAGPVVGYGYKRRSSSPGHD
jgi:DsbC/DsbD-like thiol-disulfide interchange protein